MKIIDLRNSGLLGKDCFVKLIGELWNNGQDVEHAVFSHRGYLYLKDSLLHGSDVIVDGISALKTPFGVVSIGTKMPDDGVEYELVDIDPTAEIYADWRKYADSDHV